MRKEKAMITRSFGMILALMLVLTGCSASTADRWQEQYDLGVQYLSDGNYEEAILAFTAAIEIEPMRAPAYVGRGNTYVQLSYAAGNSSLPQGMTYEEAAALGLMENLDAARADYEKAIELDEMDADAYLGLADIYIRQGDFDRALEVLQQGLEKTGNNQLREKIQEFEEGVITDSSGEIRAVLNENPGEGQPKYLEVVHPEPGKDLRAVIDGKSNLVVVLDAGEYTVDFGFNDLTNVTFWGTEGTRLISYDGSETIAQFYDCTDITLKNLTMGHELPPQVYSCEAGVLWFNNTEVTLENCDIFGCGLYGVYAVDSDVTAVHTTIRDCSESIMSLVFTNAVFQDCVFSGNGYDMPAECAVWMLGGNDWSEQPAAADSFSIAFSGCEFTGNQNPTLYQNASPDKIDVAVEGCTFSGNAWGDV